MVVGLGWIIAAARQAAKWQRELESSVGAAIPRSIPDARRPKTFAIARDSAGFFELSYPAEWELRNSGGAIQVCSRKLGSIARAETLEDSPDFWEPFKRDGLEISADASPERASGRVKVEGVTFECALYAWKARGRRIVLSTYNVVDSRRGKALEDYEDRVLRRIRSHFRILEP
jgi:hypothetical protein